MDYYFYSKIAFSLLLSGVIGFFVGSWWAWNVFSSWRKRTSDTYDRQVADLESQIAESDKRLNEEKANGQEFRAQVEASEAKARATEARLRSLEDSTRIQLQSSNEELLAARDLVSAFQPKLKLLEQREAEVQSWMTRFDSLVVSKDSELSSLQGKLQDTVTDKDRTISELMEKLAAASSQTAAAERASEDFALKQQLEEQLADYRQTIATWEIHVSSLTQDHAAKLDEATRTIDALRAELSNIQANLSDRNEAISRLEADAALLVHVRQSMRERQTQIDGLKLQLNQSRDSHHNTEKQLADLKAFVASSRDAQAREKQAEIDGLTAELDATRANLSDRNEAISRLEADAALLSHVRQSMRERQTRIDGLTLQLTNAKKALADATHSHASEIEQLHAAVAERERQIQLLNDNLFAGSGASASSPGEVEQLRTALEAKEAELCEASAAVARSQNETGELAQAISERDRQLQLLQENLVAAGAQANTGELETALAKLNDEAAHLRNELQDREERLTAWESRYEATLGELHEEAGRLQMRIRAMESIAPPEKPAAPAAPAPLPSPVEPPAPQVAPDVQARLRLATMRGIQFLPDGDEIEAGSLPILQNAIEALRALDGSNSVEIAGHTDAWGDDAANLHLSERRAAAVKSYLVSHGINAATLEAKGYGGSRPIADNLTADGRYANRRIEFIVRG